MAVDEAELCGTSCDVIGHVQESDIAVAFHFTTEPLGKGSEFSGPGTHIASQSAFAIRFARYCPASPHRCPLLPPGLRPIRKTPRSRFSELPHFLRKTNRSGPRD